MLVTANANDLVLTSFSRKHRPRWNVSTLRPAQAPLWGCETTRAGTSLLYFSSLWGTFCVLSASDL